jgi:hypothetical protein
MRFVALLERLAIESPVAYEALVLLLLQVVNEK